MLKVIIIPLLVILLLVKTHFEEPLCVQGTSRETGSDGVRSQYSFTTIFKRFIEGDTPYVL